MEPHKTTDRAMAIRLPYANREGKEYETGGKISSIRQETQAEKICRNNDQTKSITVNGNVK